MLASKALLSLQSIRVTITDNKYWLLLTLKGPGEFRLASTVFDWLLSALTSFCRLLLASKKVIRNRSKLLQTNRSPSKPVLIVSPPNQSHWRIRFHSICYLCICISRLMPISLVMDTGIPRQTNIPCIHFRALSLYNLWMRQKIKFKLLFINGICWLIYLIFAHWFLYDTKNVFWACMETEEEHKKYE